MELIRSVIFVPGNQTKMLERALAFNADVILVDLEDSVPPSEKVNAREMARDWVPRLQREGRRVMVRVNALDTGLTRDEVAAVMGPDLNGVSVGKIESPWDV
ncbi:MAG: aldolase/citrate lyase family protein, partial [Dehalococcoidia bacterium]|nr:aldolase/citrate lyase family protein [Dehalococcoidia bacterium]